MCSSLAQSKSSPRQRILAIVGPTACGKSNLALALAEQLGGELINCDSVQVYRGFNIGCAKPTAEEQARVPHHLLDVANWDEPFDAQRFRDLALDAINSVRGRGRLPILCGGTGLYLRALRFGLVDVPPVPNELRASFYQDEARQPGILFDRLRRIDPEAARKIEPQNLVYVVRALEIHAVTGEPASRIRARHGFGEELVPMHVIVLERPASELRERITLRCERMLSDGFIGEVSSLLAQGVTPEARPMRAVGYKEVSSVVLGRESAEGLSARIVCSTAAYAKRQRTWFRRERDVRRIDVSTLEKAIEAARESWCKASD